MFGRLQSNLELHTMFPARRHSHSPIRVIAHDARLPRVSRAAPIATVTHARQTCKLLTVTSLLSPLAVSPVQRPTYPGGRAQPVRCRAGRQALEERRGQRRGDARHVPRPRDQAAGAPGSVPPTHL